MEAGDKSMAEAVLRHILVGTEILGVRFAVDFTVEFSDLNMVRYDPIHLTIETRWTTFASAPSRLPAGESDLPQLTLGEQLSLLAQLRGEKVVDVSLGETYAHLTIVFGSGKVLFVNGYQDRYESWQLSASGDGASDDALIVALPGGGVAIWAPKSLS